MGSTHDYQAIQRIKRQRAATLARIIGGAYYRWRRKQMDDMYRFVCDEFIGMGGVYVKFLQGVLLRSEFMKRSQNDARLRVFEDLDREPLDIEAILAVELSAEKRKHITNVNPVPFAAGSFGQVYYGMHSSGKPVIIKVLRPLIKETLKFDLRLISIFTKRFSKRLSPNTDFDIKKPLEDFKNATLRETDYKSEAAFANEMYQAYRGHDHFVIPETFIDLCTDNIIVQEYLDGISAAHLVKMKSQGHDPHEYVRHYLDSDLSKQLTVLGYEYLLGIFTLPRIQGDPHPGNVRLMRDDKVGLIDFGIYADAPKEKAALYGLLEQYNGLYQGKLDVPALFGQFMRFFSPELYRALERINQLLPPDKQSDNLARDIGEVASVGFHKKTSTSQVEHMIKDGTIIKSINQLTNKDNRFGLIMRIESADMIRAAQTYLTLVESLGASSILGDVFSRALEHVAKEHSEILQEERSPMSVNRSVEIIASWLGRVAERDPQLFGVLSSKMRSGEADARELEKTIQKEIKK